MIIKITAKKLKEFNTCKEGLSWFIKKYPNGIEQEWNQEFLLSLLKTEVEVLE